MAPLGLSDHSIVKWVTVQKKEVTTSNKTI